MSYKKILVLAPHTDDGELGCGGTIAKFCSEGNEVYYAAFSTCSRSLPPDVPNDTLEKEVKEAIKILGLRPENLILFDYDVRVFNNFRQEILENMITLKEKIKPDLVLVPSPMDTHQDHQVISNESIRAFKDITILGYEMPWNNLSFNTRCFIRLDEKYLDTKVKAIKEYHSQSGRKYVTKDFIFSLAKVRGLQINTPYAEAFEIIRMIL